LTVDDFEKYQRNIENQTEAKKVNGYQELRTAIY